MKPLMPGQTMVQRVEQLENEMQIRNGIGWKPDSDSPGRLVTAEVIDYVADNDRLRAAIASSCDEQRYEALGACERASKAEAEIEKLRAVLKDMLTLYDVF